MESVYEKALALEPVANGMKAVTQEPLSVVYRNKDLGCGFRIDLLVEDSVVIELKAVDALPPIHQAQLLTYLRL